MIAEVVPAAGDLATKADVLRLEAKLESLHASTLHWMIGLFLPAWAATAGTLLTLVVKS